MRTEFINRYTNGIADRSLDTLTTGDIKKSGEVNISQKVNKSNDLNSVNGQSQAYNNIITGSERQFFIRMFPESEEQIKNHVLFNRNGKINTPNINKGSIVDGRV